MRFVRRLWKRHVTGRPDRYQAYVSFPTADGQPPIGDLHDRIEELERVFEGRLDVYARTRGIAVVTDRVTAGPFDEDAFEAALDRIEDCYAETHSLVRLEKWRSTDGGLVKVSVAVPVKPLFPDRTATEPTKVESAAE